MMSVVDYFHIIHKYLPPESAVYQVYLPHVALVTAKALQIARRLGLTPAQQRFIEEAAMLHDIGIIKVERYSSSAEALPYVCHAPQGRALLEQEGLPRHALVAERHIGVGLTQAEIVAQRLPLPLRDMLPETIEEKIICWADLFFSKTPPDVWREKTFHEVQRHVTRYGPRQAQAFQEWAVLFGNGGKATDSARRA